MARHHGPLLVDTNVILESHRIGSWRALVGGYRIETVNDCVTETQTGFQRRRSERQIDAHELRASLAAVHLVADRERAELAVRVFDIALDRGEASLWAHALNRNDDWILCGPDRASLRCGVRLGFRERLLSLERLLDDVGHRPVRPLLRRALHKKNGYDRAVGQIVLAEAMQRHEVAPCHGEHARLLSETAGLADGCDRSDIPCDSRRWR